MDIAKLSTAMAGANVAQSVQISMLKRAIIQMEQTGQQLAQMLQVAAIQPTSGESVIDIKI